MSNGISQRLGRLAEGGPDSPLGPNGLGLTYSPMPNTFKFRMKEVVNTWVEGNDTKAIIEHAWELWGGLSTVVTQQVDGHFKGLGPRFRRQIEVSSHSGIRTSRAGRTASCARGRPSAAKSPDC